MLRLRGQQLSAERFDQGLIGGIAEFIQEEDHRGSGISATEILYVEGLLANEGHRLGDRFVPDRNARLQQGPAAEGGHAELVRVFPVPRLGLDLAYALHT